MGKNNQQEQTGRKLGYARVSTKKQSLDVQLIALKDAGCEKIYSDHGVSGRIFPRKGLSAVLRALRSGDTLVVHRLDRLGRITLELLKIEDALRQRGIRMHFIMQPIDLTTASGKLSFTIFAATAEHESTINGERTKGGLAVKRANGVRLGRRKALNDDQIIVAKRMFEDEQMSFSAIGRTFEVSPNTVKRALVI